MVSLLIDRAVEVCGVYVVGVSDLAAARNNAHFRKHGYDIDDEVVLYADDKDNGKLEFKSVNDLMQYMQSVDKKHLLYVLFAAFQGRDSGLCNTQES